MFVALSSVFVLNKRFYLSIYQFSVLNVTQYQNNKRKLLWKWKIKLFNIGVLKGMTWDETESTNKQVDKISREVRIKNIQLLSDVETTFFYFFLTCLFHLLTYCLHSLITYIFCFGNATNVNSIQFSISIFKFILRQFYNCLWWTSP